MKILKVAVALLSVSSMSAKAQSVDVFDKFVNQSLSEYNTFISEANREFLDFIRQPWDEVKAEVLKESFQLPELPQMPVYRAVPVAVKVPSVIPVIPSVQVPETLKPEVVPARPVAPVIDVEPIVPVVPIVHAKPAETPESPLYVGGADRTKVSFLGVDYYVSNQLADCFKLSGLEENSLADGLEALYKSDYEPLMDDLRQLRKDDLGNDWALYLMTGNVCEKLIGGNESVLMRQFLLNNLGYKARVARRMADNTLTLMLPANSMIYGKTYLTDRGVRYYDIDADRSYPSYRICPREAPGAVNLVDMNMLQMPRYKGDMKMSTHTGERYNASATVSVPVPLIDFFSKTPQMEYPYYANAKVDQALSSRLLSSLQSAIEGKTETEAADVLLDFVQSGFDYATDPQQFGYEKPFFVEELFYYPKCDCEDRSILYRYLMTNLLGLDVVLIKYPNHVATGVKFNSDVKGNYFVDGGSKYFICDPTFVGASVGVCMPDFKDVAAEVVK